MRENKNEHLKALERKMVDKATKEWFRKAIKGEVIQMRKERKGETNGFF